MSVYCERVRWQVLSAVFISVRIEVKRSIKKDKRDYIDNVARQAETEAGQGNLRDLCLVTKKLTGKFQQTD